MHGFPGNPHGPASMHGLPFGMYDAPFGDGAPFDPYEPVTFPFGMYRGNPYAQFGYPQNRRTSDNDCNNNNNNNTNNGNNCNSHHNCTNNNCCSHHSCSNHNCGNNNTRDTRDSICRNCSSSMNSCSNTNNNTNNRGCNTTVRRWSDQHSQCDNKLQCDQQSQSVGCDGPAKSTQCDHTKRVTVVEHAEPKRCVLGKETPTVMFKYFDLTPLKVYGRGGVVRMLMNYHKMPYEEESYAFDLTGTWPDRKQILIASGANPSGSLPVVEIDGFQLSEHNAILRYLCGTNNVRPRSIEVEAISDMILDKIVPLRDGSLKAVLCGDAAVKERWITERLQHYTILETLIAKHGHPQSGLISGACDLRSLQPSDFSIYCVIHDDSRLHGSVLDQYPALSKLMSTVQTEPSVQRWADENDYLPVPF